MSGFDDTHFPLPPRRTGWGRLLFAAVLAFVVGGAAAGWTILHHGATFAGWSLTPPHSATAPAAVAPVEAHLATLEARLARLDLEAQAAASNAGRAEALLTALARKANEVLSREEIAEALGMDDSGERAIDVQMTRLRRKIEVDPREPRFLHTVRGRGYVLKPGV